MCKAHPSGQWMLITAKRERVFINSVSSSVVVWSCIIEQDVKSLALSHTDLILIWDLSSVLMFKLPTPNRISALDHSWRCCIIAFFITGSDGGWKCPAVFYIVTAYVHVISWSHFDVNLN